MPDKRALLEDLRGKIADIERKPVLAEKGAAAAVTEGRLSVATGMLHEVFADGLHDIAAATGFSLALVPTSKAVIHIQLVAEGAALGLPYGPGLVADGIDLDRFVLVRPKTIEEALWACEEAAGCRSVGAIILELARHRKELDFKAARRLAMRASSQGTSIFVIRFGKGREASPASLRWHVAPAPSLAKPYDDHAPGPARWKVTLERGRVEGMRQETSALVHRGVDGLVIRQEKPATDTRRIYAEKTQPLQNARRAV